MQAEVTFRKEAILITIKKKIQPVDYPSLVGTE